MPIEKREMLSPYEEGPCDTVVSNASSKVFSKATTITYSKAHRMRVGEYQELR